MYAALNRTMSNRTMQSQNQGPHHQSSYDTSALQTYYAAFRGNYLPMFWDKVSVPSSRVKKSKERTEHGLTILWPAGHIYVPLTKSLFKSAACRIAHSIICTWENAFCLVQRNRDTSR